jgi:predicted Zn-dependent protease
MTYYYGGGGQQRGGFKARWAVAIVIALVGVIGFLSKKSVNPTTGEKQYVALSADQEKALGLQAAPEMARQNGGAVDPRTDPAARTVALVGQKIVQSSDAGSPKSPYAGNFHFYLLNNEDMINAFALPGGQIFITRALYDKLENEAELAGVLGHEIGHVIHRHSAQQMAKGQLGASLSTAAGVGSNDARVAVGAQMANQMLQLRYGRNDESQSDKTGLTYMADAGYDPRAMLEVMKVLEKASAGGRTPDWMQSHPLPKNRLREVDQIIKKDFTPEELAKLTTGKPLEH